MIEILDWSRIFTNSRRQQWELETNWWIWWTKNGAYVRGMYSCPEFSPKEFPPTEFSPNGNFAERKFRRTEFSMSDFLANGIFAKPQDVLISQVDFRIYAAYFIVKLCFQQNTCAARCINYIRLSVTHMCHHGSQIIIYYHKCALFISVTLWGI